MRKISLSFAAASLLLSSTPALAATEADCNRMTSSTRRAACLRLYERSASLKEGSNVHERVRNTVDFLRKLRQNRRSDLENRYRGNSREESVNTLAERRQKALTERQERVMQRRERKQTQAKERQKLLRQRVRDQAAESVRNNVIGKDSLRRKSRTMDSRVQQRRNAIKRAQAQCADERGTATYRSCLGEKRNLLLESY